MKPLHPTDFSLGAERVDEVLEALRQRFQLQDDDIAPDTRTWFDTFDWRLHDEGVRLTLEPGRRGRQLVWTGARGRRVLRLDEVGLDTVPVFAWDFPDGELRRLLEPVLEMRRLLPLARLERRGPLLRVLDERRKTVVRLRLLEGEVRRPGDDEADGPGDGDAVSLPIRLRLTPVRGYDEAADTVRGFLDEHLGLSPLDDDLFAEALAAVGRRPGDYSSKVRLALEPDMAAADAARAIHLALLDVLEANEDGTRRDLDSEFLHDFRVAVRRTRSALGQVKGVFPAERVERFRAGFSWLGKLTGPTRDLDVYLLKMPDYRASLPPQTRRDLQPLRDFLEAHQRQEQRALARALDGERYRRLVADWRHFLEHPPAASDDDAPNARTPVLELAAARIWKIYRGILKRGRKIDDDSPADDLHRIRIQCKKLRYLMEFFRSLFPDDDIGRAVKALKKLQDNLGDFNDYEVQQAALAGFAEQMAEDGDVPAATLLAMGRLVAHLEEGQAAERRAFHRRFERFASERHRDLYRRLFRRG